jgi:hypothetical protein
MCWQKKHKLNKNLGEIMTSKNKFKQNNRGTISDKLKYYQPTNSEVFNENFYRFRVWFDKDRCETETLCEPEEILELSGSNIIEPLFMITIDEALLWAFENLNVGESQFIAREVERGDLFKGESEQNDLFKEYRNETIKLIRTSNGVQIEFFNVATYDENLLTDDSRVDTINSTYDENLLTDDSRVDTINSTNDGLNDALNLKLSKNPTLEQFREDLKFQLSFEDLDWKYFLETAQRAYEESQSEIDEKLTQ